MRRFEKFRMATTVSLLSSGLCIAGPAARAAASAGYERPAGLVEGGAFVDLIRPIPVYGGLETNCWGGDNVKPRAVRNGIEDPKWSYWCASPVRGPDGREHLFTVRWPQEKGHKYWVRSELVHAVSDRPTGPFTVVEEMGPGHNAEVYRAKDGTFVVSVTGMDYRSGSLDGPWRKVKPEFDVREPSMSNKTFARREDGSVLMILRSGTVWLSDDGLGPFRRIVPTSVYPFDLARGSTAFEDPVLWRDEVQYHLIVNNWPMRRAFYGRSRDGIHWTWSPGTAYDNTVVRHPDGAVEGWFKAERPKVRQDDFGRATHLLLAVIDCPKDQCTGADSSSSKSVVLPLVPGRRLAILNDAPLDAGTRGIRVEIKAEEGFDPAADVAVESLSFGAPGAVDFGRGCKAVKSERSGAGLVVTFDGTGHEWKPEDFAAKLLGRTRRGDLLFGYARRPGFATHEPLPVARAPALIRRDDSTLGASVEIENAGLVKSPPVPLRMVFRGVGADGKPAETTAVVSAVAPALEPYGRHIVEWPAVESGALMTGRTNHVFVTLRPGAPAEDTFAFKGVVAP